MGDLTFRSHADGFVQSLSRRLDILSYFVGKVRTVESENGRQKQTFAWKEEARIVGVKVRASARYLVCTHTNTSSTVFCSCFFFAVAASRIDVVAVCWVSLTLSNTERGDTVSASITSGFSCCPFCVTWYGVFQKLGVRK